MASPWAKIQPVEGPISLMEITSEQLARSLQDKETKKQEDQITATVPYEDPNLFETAETDSDEVIAHMLQAQYNKEYDHIIKLTEKKFNRDARVNISYSNYRICSVDEPEEKIVDTEDKARDVDRFVSIEKEYASLKRCGYKIIGEGSQIVTKHDMLMSSRINACRVLEFPPGIETGDTGGFDVKLNNRVFNGLRAHSNAQRSRHKPKTKPHTK